jgi:hypothetical protein
MFFTDMCIKIGLVDTNGERVMTSLTLLRYLKTNSRMSLALKTCFVHEYYTTIDKQFVDISSKIWV